MKKVLLFTFLVLVLVTSCSNFEVQKAGKVYIVCVGLDYAIPENADDLYTCPKDAYDMAKALSSSYEKKGIDCDFQLLISCNPPTSKSSSVPSYLTTITNNPALSKSDILTALNSITPNAEDLIVFYFSGHGDVVGGNSYFYDMSLEHLNVEDILRVLEGKKCNCAVIVDVCHSGASYEEDSKNIFSQAVKSLFEKQEFSHIAYLASSKQDESSYIGNANLYCNNTKYTEILLDIIRSSNSLSMRELYELSSSRYKHSDQHPQLSFNNLDLFIIP